MTTTPAIADRFKHRDVTVFVAPDTVEALVAHVRGILGEDREMTVITRYRTNYRSTQVPVDQGLSTARVLTGMRVADQSEYRVPVIEHWKQEDPVGQGLHVRLSPGIHGFGFGVHVKDVASEAEARDRYRSGRYRDLTLVRCDGWPGQPSREDRIEIEHWNEHGVCEDTVIAFNR